MSSASLYAYCITAAHAGSFVHCCISNFVMRANVINWMNGKTEKGKGKQFVCLFLLNSHSFRGRDRLHSFLRTYVYVYVYSTGLKCITINT